MSNEQNKNQRDAVNDAEKFIDFIVNAFCGGSVVNNIEQLSLLYHCFTCKGKAPKNGRLLLKAQVFISDFAALKKSSLLREVTDEDIDAAAKIPAPEFLTDELALACAIACRDAAGLKQPINLRDVTGENVTL